MAASDTALPPLPQQLRAEYSDHEAYDGKEEVGGAEEYGRHSFTSASSSKRRSIPTPRTSIDHPKMRLHQAPSSPVRINRPRSNLRQSDAAEISFATEGQDDDAKRWSDGTDSYPTQQTDSVLSLPIRTWPGTLRVVDEGRDSTVSSSGSVPMIGQTEEYVDEDEENTAPIESLQYHAFDDFRKPQQGQERALESTTPPRGSSARYADKHTRQLSQQLDVPRSTSMPLPRPASAHFSAERGRALSPLSANSSENGSSHPYSRDSSSRRSASSRPSSYIDLLNNVPHSQQVAPVPSGHQSLQSAVGSAASLLDTKKTLDMYRLNVKKTNDAAVQYEFAILMINTARSAPEDSDLKPAELINEAKHILQRLADRAYPFAQYYLGDGYFSGLFNKNKPDHDKAFHLFVQASKHGHAEAGYRAALCYEFAWGTSKNYSKAVQFYRTAASKNHPGAATRLGLACVRGDMGVSSRDRYREGVKWLKRASESADFQYNAAPYELGLFHLEGYGSEIFHDEAYAAQLFTQSAELGHVDANLLMGRAYENGLYGCPRDAALSVHFYNGAATKGNPEAMMALCAWYMVGAEPVMERDEGEACAWAVQAAETGKTIPKLCLQII